ncbi:hypothetical protein [Mycolicibacterium sp. CR10]|uniref:hypothetical protein n=1 Tax=Mycolicibacterium sp. CR10 TaxID=2562314 RepID=UPI0014851683|nr:hypothetical protein [Mycolicibacterium sp. CR10]
MGTGIEFDPLVVDRQHRVVAKSALQLPQCLTQLPARVQMLSFAPQRIGEDLAVMLAATGEKQVTEKLLGPARFEADDDVLPATNLESPEEPYVKTCAVRGVTRPS